MLRKAAYLVITPFFPSQRSHHGSYIYDQINEIRNQSNFNIRVIKVVSLFSTEIDYVYDSFKVSILKMVDFPFFILPGLFSFINKNRILTLLRRDNIESITMVHGHTSYPSAFLSNCIADKFKCKGIVQHHGLDVLQLLNGRSNFIKKLQRNYLIKKTISQLNKSDLNIGVSELVLNQLREYSTYCPKDEFVLYNGVDTSKFYQINGDENKTYTIGCIANFWEIKDQISLIIAFELLILDGITDIQLKFIGSGKKLEFCMNFVRDHNLAAFIFFEKERSHTLINDFYNDIDLFVLPSYYEALGCVYLESWSTNTPFIAVKNQGISELIPEHEIDKLLAEEKSPKSLKEKILGEYIKKRNFPFEERYDIKNTIFDFLSLDIFKKYD